MWCHRSESVVSYTISECRQSAHLPQIGLTADFIARKCVAVNVRDLGGKLPHHLAFVVLDQLLLFQRSHFENRFDQ